jgi:hypothetical protein
MLPGCVGKRVEAVFYPIVSGFFAAGRTEPGFTRMRSFKSFVAVRANKQVISEEFSTADKKFQDINDDTDSDKAGMFKKKFPPVSVVQEDVPEFDFGIVNIFHIVIVGLYQNSFTFSSRYMNDFKGIKKVLLPKAA